MSLFESETTPSKLSTPAFEHSQFSPYDTIENLNFQANSLFASLDKLNATLPEQQKIIEEVKTGILNLLSGWEEAYEAKIETPALPNKNLTKKEQDLEDEIERLRDEYEIRVSDLEFRLKETEDAHLKLHATHQEKLKEIDHDIDEIMHHYKRKWKKKPEMGNILQDLFSQEELEEEGRIALGEKKRVTQEINIKKLDVSNEEKWDMNLESEDSSGPPSALEGSGLIFYDKLHDLKKKLYNYRHQSMDEGSNKNSLDNAFMESLPISMKSVSNGESIKLTNLLSGLKSRDSSLLLDQNYGKVSGDFKSSITTKPEFEKSLDIGTILSEKLSLDEKEQLVLTLINQEMIEGNDVCLDDLLGSEPSNKASTILATEQSDNSFSSFLQASRNNIESLNLSGSVTFKMPDNSFHLCTENSENDKSMEKPNLGLMLSPIQSGFLPPIRKNSPKLDLNISNENSSIFPSLNTSFETSSIRKRPKLPLFPKPPSDPPIKGFLNIRGRSLQPISTPKSKMIPDISESKFVSPGPVINFRMKRFREMTRPNFKITEGVVPQEPQKFSNIS